MSDNKTQQQPKRRTLTVTPSVEYAFKQVFGHWNVWHQQAAWFGLDFNQVFPELVKIRNWFEENQKSIGDYLAPALDEWGFDEKDIKRIVTDANDHYRSYLEDDE